MGSAENDYDVLCTNDTRQIKLAVKGDAFHAASIQSETVKKIDLSGGTRHVEELTFAHCLKFTRIIWPADTGAIKRLAIHSADALTLLDVSALTNLEELSIFDCPELESITGLGKTVKVVNAHGVNLATLDVASAKELETLNINTTHPSFSITVKKSNTLQFLLLQGEKIKCTLQHCHNLVTLLVDSKQDYAEIHVSDCPGIIDACINTGKNTALDGFIDCKKHILHQRESGKFAEVLKLASNFIDPIIKHKPAPEDMETVIQKFGTSRERNHARIVMISLLSSMEKNFSHDLRKELQSSEMFSSFTESPENILFVDELDNKIPQDIIEDARRFNKDHTNIVDWLKNREKYDENILILDEKDMKDSSIINLLKQINQMQQKRLPITFLGIQYKISPQHKIIAVRAPKHLIAQSGQSLFHAAAAVPAALTAPVPAAAPVTTKDKMAEKYLSISTMRRMIPTILRKLDERQPMKQAAMRRISHKSDQFFTLCDQLQKNKTAKLSQTKQSRIAAAAKTIERQKLPKIPTSGSIDAPPALTDYREPPSLFKPYSAKIPFNKSDESIEQNLDLTNTQKLPISGRPDSPIGITDYQDKGPELVHVKESQNTDTQLDIHIDADEQDLHLQEKVKSGIKPEDIAAPPALTNYQDKGPELANVKEVRKTDTHLDINTAASEQDLHLQEKAKSGTNPEGIAAPPALTNYQDNRPELANVTIKASTHSESEGALDINPEGVLDINAELTGVDKVAAIGTGDEKHPPVLVNPEDRVSVNLQPLHEAYDIHIKHHIEGQLDIKEVKASIAIVEDFADAVGELCEAAKVRALPQEQISAPILIIEESVSIALAELKISEKIVIESEHNPDVLSIAPDRLLDAARELEIALKNLNAVCQTALEENKDKSERERLIMLLKNASVQFMQKNKVNDSSSGVFGTGYKAGLNKVRMTMLDDLLQTLKSNQQLTVTAADKNLAELCKDATLKHLLQPEIDSLRMHLITPISPTKTNK